MLIKFGFQSELTILTRVTALDLTRFCFVCTLSFIFSLKAHGGIMQTRFKLGSDWTRFVVLGAGEGQMFDLL